jgi:hypothetical protein
LVLRYETIRQGKLREVRKEVRKVLALIKCFIRRAQGGYGSFVCKVTSNAAADCWVGWLIG